MGLVRFIPAWEGMTMTMLLLRDGWEQEWRFVDDVPDDGQEPVCPAE